MTPLIAPPVVLTLVVVSILCMILLTARFKCNIFLTMFLISLVLGFATLAPTSVIDAAKEGFGGTLKAIGIIIVLGIMIGLLLERSGATMSLALAILRVTGQRRADWAVGISGLLVGIPIFCDSGFVVLSGLNRSLVAKSGYPMPYMATLMGLGLFSVHCLIPPHPGALAAAGIMDTSIGGMIGLGLLLAIVGVIPAFAWAYFVSGRPASPSSGSDGAVSPPSAALPAPLLAALPILVPLLLLSGRSAVQLLPRFAASAGGRLLQVVGQPELALLVGVGLAALLCLRQREIALGEILEQAIDKTGPILVLTAAGGVFGAIIKATGVGDYAGQLLAQSGLGIAIPFVVAAFLKTALGSSTVAVMTAASIVVPMLGALGLESQTQRLLATLALGAGSMVASHTNDSYFWVVTRFSDLSARQTLRVFTTGTIVLGTSVFLLIWLLSRIL